MTAHLHAESRLKHMIHASFRGILREDATYAVITEFLLEHKRPAERFVLYPQLSIRWKPEDPRDTRSEVPDIAVAFTLQTPHFKMRLRIEAKRLLSVMHSLPDPHAIQGNKDVFHSLFYQGEDQASKGDYALSSAIPYLLFVGPYFTSVTFGPFSQGELGVRTHKSSDSGDYDETIKAEVRLASRPIPRPFFYSERTTYQSHIGAWRMMDAG